MLCEEIETCLNKNNSNRAYLLVKRSRLGPPLSRKILGNVLLKKKGFSANGQNIAQNCATMRVMEKMQYRTVASLQKKIYNRSSVRKLRLQ